jgi:hypothetical protein
MVPREKKLPELFGNFVPVDYQGIIKIFSCVKVSPNHLIVRGNEEIRRV